VTFASFTHVRVLSGLIMVDTEVSSNVSKLPLLIMGAVLAIAVLVTVALIAGRDTKTYSPGTPEAAVQDFIQAGFDNDKPALLASLTTDARASCEADLARQRFDDHIYTEGLRAALEDMEMTNDDTAIAEVRFHQDNTNNLFDTSGWSHDERFTLTRIDGDWLIDKADWPYQFGDCTRSNR
jgi:hypothetical protein